MKTILILLTLILFTSCTDERESEHFQPQHQIKVNFDSKKGSEGGNNLQIANDNETAIIEKIIRNQELPENFNYQTVCSGSNDRGLQFAYIEIKGDLNGLFLTVFDENRLMVFRIESFSGNCLLKWVSEV
ncbi:hypothetical protein AB670_00030 [Chryseobacterium sp. MOF25P]|uniref:hypothetical protein n=1 Tax=unclassified Chryseobacterium TaxID=2593645 RepID=UPI000805E991|nr:MULTISPECIES: hypothetical protein [unclassified Chryseobacterium]OBW43501.1 hypothetical protein AB670_00030 [Chryseobacterium sp. MOF25P]OBW46725.1 hypothetical protein AB671_01221 [Chryseobacterium sp. BGARF1]